MAVFFEISNDNREEILKMIQDATIRALETVGFQAESYAKLGAPVDTGRLRNSISHAFENDNTMQIGTNVEYAIFQELGTSRGVTEKRYLTNAVRNHISEYQNIIESEFRKG